MPYEIDPNNRKCVRKADSKKRVGCTKGSVKKYLAALHANVKDIKESEEFKWVDWVVDKTNQIPTNINDFKIGQKFVIDKDDNNRGPYRVEVIKTNVIDFDGYGNRRTDTIKVKSLDDFTKKLWGDNFLVRPDYIINNILNGTWRLVDDIKESEKNEFEWVKDISMMLGFDDLKIGDIVKLKGYDPNDWEVVDIYMTASYMTGKPSEKRIKFKRTKGNSYGNSYLELWKSSLNSENYFELVDRKLFESEEGQFDWVKDSISEFESSPAFGYYQEIKNLLQDDYNIKIEESRTSKSKVFKIYDLYGDIVDAWSERHFRPEIIEEDLKSQTEFYRDRISVLYELLVPFFKKHGLIKNINESEEDDFEWAKETVKGSFLEYRHKEIMIDIRELSLEELKKLYDIVLPYTNDKGIFINDEGEEIYWGDHLQCFKNIVDGSLKKKAISLHCGIEDNEYQPLKGAVCCLNSSYENEPNKENIIPINARELIGGKINESEEWYNEILSEKPLLKFDDLMVGDVIVNISPNFLTRSPESKFQLTYFNVLSFEDGKTWRNAYEEPEKYVICNLVKENPDTGNFIPVSRTDLKFPRGTNQPIWTLIYREGVLEESEWFEDVVSDPIMLKVEDLEMGDIVIPTCVKEGEYIVNGKGTSVKLLDAPTHWVTLKRRTKANTGGIFIEHDTEIGKNCRFKLIHRENDIIEESEEDDFEWVGDIIKPTVDNLKYLKINQEFIIKKPAGADSWNSNPKPMRLKIVKKSVFGDDLYYVTSFDSINKKWRDSLTPFSEYRIIELITSGYWTPINDIKESEEDYDWTKEIIESASIFDYNGKEIMIDISDLDEEEINQVIEIIKPYILHFDATKWSWFKNDAGEEISWKNDCLKSNVGYTKKTISLHCGVEENDYKPLKGAVCCLSTGYHDEPEEVKDQIINVDIKPFLTPKRLEESEKKPLLNEGRYDAITRRVVRDIMKVLTTNPEGGDYDLPYDLDENEHEYQQLGLGFSLEVQIIRTDEMEDDFYIDASTSDDDEYENVMLMTIFLNDNFSEKNYQKLFYKLQEVVRHEIEHFTQQGTYRIEDRPIYKGNTVNLKTVYGHHKNVIEVPALVHGFYRRAKLEKRPLDEIMMEDLDSEIEKGFLTKNQAEKLLSIWIDYTKKNLPAAIYKQN
jgi:hypothetical protein